MKAARFLTAAIAAMAAISPHPAMFPSLEIEAIPTGAHHWKGSKSSKSVYKCARAKGENRKGWKRRFLGWNKKRFGGAS